MSTVTQYSRGSRGSCKLDRPIRQIKSVPHRQSLIVRMIPVENRRDHNRCTSS